MAPARCRLEASKQAKTINRVGSIFCDECDYDFHKSKEAAPINYDEPRSYTPKHLADKILTTRGSIEGERKLVTVLFADVANYSALAEKIDPKEVHQITFNYSYAANT